MLLYTFTKLCVLKKTKEHINREINRTMKERADTAKVFMMLTKSTARIGVRTDVTSHITIATHDYRDRTIISNIGIQ